MPQIIGQPQPQAFGKPKPGNAGMLRPPAASRLKSATSSIQKFDPKLHRSVEYDRTAMIQPEKDDNFFQKLMDNKLFLVGGGLLIGFIIGKMMK